MADWGREEITAQHIIELLGRAAIDADFRRALLGSPEEKLRELGFTGDLRNLTRFLSLIKEDGLDQAFEKIHAHFQDLGGPRNA